MPEPIEQIEWRDVESLRANGYNPNRVHKPEMRLLKHNLLTHGWIQPILVNREGVIIDGFHRWTLSREDKQVRARWDGKVPCAVMDISEAQAMALTVRVNRAKGTHVALAMHDLVVSLMADHGWTVEQIAKEIGATRKEVEVLAQEGVFKVKKINEWAYSPAWYPGETRIHGPAPEQP